LIIVLIALVSNCGINYYTKFEEVDEMEFDKVYKKYNCVGIG